VTRLLLVIFSLLLSACACSSPLHDRSELSIPSPGFPTPSQALDEVCGRIKLNLAAGQYQLSEGEVDDALEWGVSFTGCGNETTLIVPEGSGDKLGPVCSQLRISERVVYKSSFRRFLEDLGGGLWYLFRCIFTGR